MNAITLITGIIKSTKKLLITYGTSPDPKFIQGEYVRSMAGDINKDINLNKTFDVIIVQILQEYHSLDLIQNIPRLCTKDTKLIFYYDGDIPRSIEYHRSWFINIVTMEGFFICNLSIDLPEKLPTIITSIYDIRSIEGTHETTKVKGIDIYMEKGRDLTELEIPMVIFTEDSLKDKILDMRKGKEHITDIRCMNVEHFKYYQYIDKLISLTKVYDIINSSKTKDTPLYIILTNNKFSFIRSAGRD